ncbi:hypothetical protein QA612_04110 [Evansella sp. AB-P1]|uniref:hypothetical protein n=1 Tax=Evansella sp. AB-P1 TaxID=3037653 RepID=UPI00241E1577|nr:hypothetical protein [Evansella sp. AB-P1]MDG5786664.1 hypothetical protein [Evansella sp. AB-P1]
MSNQRDVMARSIALLDTINEGIEYTEEILYKEDFSAAIQMIEDTLMGYVSVKNALKVVDVFIEDIEEVELLQVTIEQSFRDLTNSFDNNSFDEAKSIVENQLKVEFQRLKVIIKKDFNDFMLT